MQGGVFLATFPQWPRVISSAEGNLPQRIIWLSQKALSTDGGVKNPVKVRRGLWLQCNHFGVSRIGWECDEPGRARRIFVGGAAVSEAAFRCGNGALRPRHYPLRLAVTWARAGDYQLLCARSRDRDNWKPRHRWSGFYSYTVRICG